MPNVLRLTDCVYVQSNLQVAWIRLDSGSVLSIDLYTFTRDNRISVDRSISNEVIIVHLNIKSITEKDRGAYKYQIQILKGDKSFKDSEVIFITADQQVQQFLSFLFSMNFRLAT